LMLVLYRSGRQADALTAFQDARHTLVDELGIDPPGWSNSTAGSCSKTRHWEQSPLRSCIRPLAAHRPRQTRPAWSRGPRSSGLPSNRGGSSARCHGQGPSCGSSRLGWARAGGVGSARGSNSGPASGGRSVDMRGGCLAAARFSGVGGASSRRWVCGEFADPACGGDHAGEPHVR
jgi:hypothetical protein